MKRSKHPSPTSDKFDRYEDGSVVFPNGGGYDPEERRYVPPAEVARRRRAQQEQLHPQAAHSAAIVKAILALRGVRGDINAPAPPPHGFVLFPPNTPLGQLQRAYGVTRAQYDRDLP